MATIKSYTDLKQSKKLAEILPLESADYCWGIDYESRHLDFNSFPYTEPYNEFNNEDFIPCWSLTALLNVLPNYVDYDTIRRPDLMRNIDKNYMVIYSPLKYSGIYDNPVDACVDMIERLHELNLI